MFRSPGRRGRSSRCRTEADRTGTSPTYRAACRESRARLIRNVFPSADSFPDATSQPCCERLAMRRRTLSGGNESAVIASPPSHADAIVLHQQSPTPRYGAERICGRRAGRYRDDRGWLRGRDGLRATRRRLFLSIRRCRESRGGNQHEQWKSKHCISWVSRFERLTIRADAGPVAAHVRIATLASFAGASHALPRVTPTETTCDHTDCRRSGPPRLSSVPPLVRRARRPGRNPAMRPAPAAAATSQSGLTAAEHAAGWRLLFDGSTTNGWRGYKSPTVPNGWRAENGTLTKDGSVDDIVTKDQFGELRARARLEDRRPAGTPGSSIAARRSTSTSTGARRSISCSTTRTRPTARTA